MGGGSFVDWQAIGKTGAARYGMAVVAFALALLARWLLNDWLPSGFPYVTFFPAVVVTAYFAGLRPAVLCALLSGPAAWFFFIPPYGVFNLSFATTVALAFFAFVVAVDIFFIDGMRGAMRKLDAERARYAQLAEARDLLYRELHHRVSNNLQVVGALLQLQAGTVKDEGAAHALAEAGNRIEVIAQIQRDLHDGVGDLVPFRLFAEKLLRSAVTASGLHVEIAFTGGEAPVHPDQATPITLVMLECFNNALEHGFAGRAGGAIAVQLDDAGPSHELTITDDGHGPGADFDLGTSRSLGLRIVKAMATQLGGRFTLERQGDHTVSRLSFVPLAMD